MIRPWLAVLLLAVPGTPDESYAARKAYVAEKVDGAIRSGSKGLLKLQRLDGSFPFHLGKDPRIPPATQAYGLGVASIAVYTLLWCDVPVADPAVRKGLDFLVRMADTSPDFGATRGTYEISLMCCALSEAILRLRRSKTTVSIPESWSGLLKKGVAWLVAAQAPRGGWSYQKDGRGHHDHSNTQFAILGLRAAHNAGVKAPALTWERELTHLKSGQLFDGGWDYSSCAYGPRAGLATGRMTAAGILGTAMGIAAVRGKTSPKDLCEDPAIRKGLKWLQEHVRNQAVTLDYYWLYSLERACMLTGVTMLGEFDWYVEGAHALLKAQNEEGLWPGAGYGLVDSCFALLFLKRAYVPVETPSGGTPPPKPGRPRELE